MVPVDVPNGRTECMTERFYSELKGALHVLINTVELLHFQHEQVWPEEARFQRSR